MIVAAFAVEPEIASKYQDQIAELMHRHHGLEAEKEKNDEHIHKLNADQKARKVSRRERVCQFYTVGLSIDEIAEQVGVSIWTVGKDVAALRCEGRLSKHKVPLKDVHRKILSMHDAGHPAGVIVEVTGKSLRTVQRIISGKQIVNCPSGEQFMAQEQGGAIK